MVARIFGDGDVTDDVSSFRICMTSSTLADVLDQLLHRLQPLRLAFRYRYLCTRAYNECIGQRDRNVRWPRRATAN